MSVASVAPGAGSMRPPRPFGLLAEPGNRAVALNGVRGIVQAIEREDGSGHCFNVRLSTVGGDKWVFVRTAD